MPYDGIVLKSIVHELNDKIINARVEKIFQPEKDEIVLTIRNNNESLKLLICSNPSIPRVHLTNQKKENPSSPPNFCMVLRKHLQYSKITKIDSFGYERILAIDFETYSELRDKQTKRIIVEIMGKHSNIILINESNKIIDAIKHIDNSISSVREVMPARSYILPPVQDKLEPDTMEVETIFEESKLNKRIDKILVDNIMGFSPFLAKNLCFTVDINHTQRALSIEDNNLKVLKDTLISFQRKLISRKYLPCVLFDENENITPLDFYCFDLPPFKNVKYFESISNATEEFYHKRDLSQRLANKKALIIKHVTNARERILKKISIYNENINETSQSEQFKLYADLIIAFIHSIPQNADKVILSNFYSENLEDIEIPLDPFLTPQINATKYYKKYNKAKKTFENSHKLLEEARKDLEYLDNVLFSLDNVISNDEIAEIKEELIHIGILAKNEKPQKRKKNSKNKKGSSKTERTMPLEYESSDGYIIYVGKNNYQNDYLTLKLSASNDIWLHTKQIAGSHVVIKKQKGDIPQSTIYEASQLAAYHSKARNSSNVPIDYTQIRYVKKPSKSKPGMVIYTNQKTLYVTPVEDELPKQKK